MQTESGPHRSWPELKAAEDLDCDGVNPRTRAPCVFGHHVGYHRDASGAEWLDNGLFEVTTSAPYDVSSHDR